MIANQVRTSSDAEELFTKIGTVVSKFLNIDVEFLGEIPYDVNVPKAVMKQEPVTMAAPNSPAAKAIMEIVHKIENIEVPEERRGIMQLFASVIRMRIHK